MRKLGNDDGPCLHCAIMEAIDGWLEGNAPREKGIVSVDVSVVLTSLAEVAAEYLDMPPDRNQRRRALKFIHAAIDGALKAKQTGKPVLVDIPQEH